MHPSPVFIPFPQFAKLVTNMQLQSNRLSGDLPTQLGGWAKLKSLTLNDNSLSGQIPSEVGNMASSGRGGLLVGG